jgi:hypothetical protein
MLPRLTYDKHRAALGCCFSAPELLSSAIDFSLGNLSGSNQRCDARVRQFVSMLAHAIL